MQLYGISQDGSVVSFDTNMQLLDLNALCCLFFWDGFDQFLCGGGMVRLAQVHLQ